MGVVRTLGMQKMRKIIVWVLWKLAEYRKLGNIDSLDAAKHSEFVKKKGKLIVWVVLELSEVRKWARNDSLGVAKLSN